MNRIFKSMTTSIVYKIVSIITNIVVQRFILVSFGSNINGISASVSQFISYLVLLEAGIGAASIQALYAPLANKDISRVNKILSATKNQYTKIGLAFGVLLLLLGCLMSIATSQQVDAVIAFSITIFAGSSSLINFLITGKYIVLLNADKKISVIYNVDTVLNLISCAVRVLIIKIGGGIILVQSVLLLTSVLKSIFIYLYVTKRYNDINLKNSIPDYISIRQHKNVLVHQLAGVVVNHTDVTLLTFFSTLKNVSVYSVYNYIYSNLSSMMTITFSQATQAEFGHLSNEGVKKYSSVYHIYEYLYTIVLYIILTIALIMTLPFVNLYTHGVTDVEYINPELAILFCIAQFMNLIRIPSLITIQVYGWFKQTQKGAVIEAIINMAVSMILLPKYKIYGLIIGTICSYFYRTQDVIKYVYKQLNINRRRFIKNNAINMFTSIFLIIFLKKLISFFEVNNWISWCLMCGLVSFIVVSIIVWMNLIFNRKMLRKSVNMMFHRV